MDYIPTVTDDEQAQITWILGALVERSWDRDKEFPLAITLKPEVLRDWLEYIDLDADDVPDDLFANIQPQLDVRDDNPYDFELIVIHLRERAEKNSIQMIIQRDVGGGNVRLCAICDIEPEDTI